VKLVRGFCCSTRKSADVATRSSAEQKRLGQSKPLLVLFVISCGFCHPYEDGRSVKPWFFLNFSASFCDLGHAKETTVLVSNAFLDLGHFIGSVEHQLHWTSIRFLNEVHRIVSVLG
jgi:hypothetical protein